MNRCLYAPKVLFIGLLTCQLLATLHVHLSNVGLYIALQRLRDAGYLIIPNQKVMESLPKAAPALLGGLFFTLSVGAGLTLLTLAAVWIWDRLLHRKKIFTLLGLLPWLGLVFAANHRGFAPMVTAYFLIIPVVVFAVALKWLPAPSGKRIWPIRLAYSLPILLLAGLWISQMDARLFTGIRDNLLLSNRFGLKINDFYYKYTLYPAQVFKSLDQKTLKTCLLENLEKRPAALVENALLDNDYLRVNGGPPVHLKIVKQEDRLIFQRQGKTILTTSLEDFLSNPRSELKAFSSLTDRYGFFRQFTFLSLLIGFPITLYVLFFGLFCLPLCVFLSSRASSVIASMLCLISGIALFAVFSQGTSERIQVDALPDAMTSARRQTRVAALATLCEERMDIGNFQAYKKMLSSPHIAERYWLARALGASRRTDTYDDLMLLLNDPHPNVVCMVFYSLGERGDRSAIPQILERTAASDHWYEQWYAYRALRKLGWKQKNLK
jgi:Ca2+/Na+ antiporter